MVTKWPLRVNKREQPLAEREILSPFALLQTGCNVGMALYTSKLPFTAYYLIIISTDILSATELQELLISTFFP